jgi:hypothetical protein
MTALKSAYFLIKGVTLFLNNYGASFIGDVYVA